MILTITSTTPPATDLGFLLHKNPSRTQSVPLAAGLAHVFYPEATESRCTAALMLDLDPVGLVRELRGPRGEEGVLSQYVNDRPYTASSFMSVAIGRAFSSALKGRSKERPELAEQAQPLVVELSAVRCGREGHLARALFEPLGYRVDVEVHPVDPTFPDWGPSRYGTLRLEGETTVQALLNHLYVLIPVLDDDKHYWVERAEIEKLLHAGEGWLKAHPACELITNRYLRRQGRLVTEALKRLLDEEPGASEEAESGRDTEESQIERALTLNERRLEAVLRHVEAVNPKRVIDLGCGEGKVLRELMRNPGIASLTGMDVASTQIERAAQRLRLDRMSPAAQNRITLLQGSLLYKDARLEGYDVAILTEVVEHIEPSRLPDFERVVFGHARPGMLVMTTPNGEYNVKFDSLPEGRFRHRDHRFEWSRGDFESWAKRVATTHGYSCVFEGVGEADPELGAPTQLAVFTRTEVEA